MDAGVTPLSIRDELLEKVAVELLVSRREPREVWSYDLVSPFWRLYSNNGPGAYLAFGNREIPLKDRALYLVPSWVRFQTGLRQPTIHNYIHFNLRGLPLSLSRQLFDQPVRVPEDHGVAYLRKRWIDGLVARDEEPLLSSFAWAYALVSTCLATMISSLPAEKMVEAERYYIVPDDLRPAVALIEARMHLPPSNVELAAACHVSEDHFIRRFRTKMGTTPARFSFERRIAVSASLLVSSHESIDQIAERVGFHDRFHFSRMFREHLGIPPAAYRRMHSREDRSE